MQNWSGRHASEWPCKLQCFQQWLEVPSSGDPKMRPSLEGERLRKRTEERSPLSTALPRAKASASRRLHVETMYCHSQRTHWKWAKKVICPLVKDAQDCQKKSLEWIEIWKFNASGARRCTMQNWSDKRTSDSIFERKWSPKMIQNDAPRGPNGLQNPFWRHPGEQG